MLLDDSTYDVVVISPYSQKLRNGKVNPKNYPYWNELIVLFKKEGFHVIQIGVGDEEKLDANEHFFDLNIKDLKQVLTTFPIWISVDNFIQHFGAWIGKKGIVLWGQSDPDIFGHKENINLLKDRKYIRKDTFNIWEAAECNNEAFVSPEIVLEAVLKEFNEIK